MNPPQLDRRTMLKLGGTGLLSLALPGISPVFAAEDDLDLVAATRRSVNRFPRMVQEYYVKRLRAIEKAANARRMVLDTREEALAYIDDVRSKIQQCLGPWPETTPLNARITSSFKRDTYIVENIIFESRPGFLVTANLYIPTNKPHPLPGVIGTCGHTKNGKAGYQEFAQGLARQGYVVLIYDPIGQGERLQYGDGNGGSKIGVGVREHLHAGNQQFLVGENIASWRAWDGIRALDYLLTRPEVDPNHIGVTGNSGGGTMTTWLCGADQRWTMAAPSCFVTTFRRNLENEEPQDTEQCPPKALALGLDHADFLLANAPDPIIILAKEKDFFDVRGSEETFAQMQHIYSLLGNRDQIGFFAGKGPHGYTQDNREAMYRWFNAITKISDAQSEPTITIEDDKTLRCTPKGQVAELTSKTVFDFTSEKSKRLAKSRKRIANNSELKEVVAQSLRLDNLPTSAPDYRILKPVDGGAYPKPRHTRYAIETEPGIQAIAYRLSDENLPARPTHSNAEAILYVSHVSTDYELKKEPLTKELVTQNPESIFYGLDVRGIGESRPDVARSNSFLDAYGGDYMHASHGIMLDEPYVGRKTFDVLRSIQWLVSRGHTRIHLVGRGWATIPATFAALISDNVHRVTLKAAPESYASIAETELYNWPLSYIVPNVLEHFDLPDCYAHLKSRNLTLL
ncbi:MAG: prolyl oligopeptidase family serine peptidase [Candidatus Hydrogenedentota bacterium]